MLQIIGWILCLFLMVKALELAGKRELTRWDEAASALAFIGALLFAWLLYEQGKEVGRAMDDVPTLSGTM